MRCAACSGTGETTDGMCPSCLGTGLVGLSRPQNAINKDLAARLAKAERALEEAERVVKPFANYLDGAALLDNNGEPLPVEQGMGWVYLTVGDFRAARRWMESRHD